MASARVAASGTIANRSFSMPSMMLFATRSAESGLIVPEIALRLLRLVPVLVGELRRVGVGRERAAHVDPVRQQLGAQRLEESAHRELRGRVRGVAEHADQSRRPTRRRRSSRRAARSSRARPPERRSRCRSSSRPSSCGTGPHRAPGSNRAAPVRPSRWRCRRARTRLPTLTPQHRPARHRQHRPPRLRPVRRRRAATRPPRRARRGAGRSARPARHDRSRAARSRDRCHSNRR